MFAVKMSYHTYLNIAPSLPECPRPTPPLPLLLVQPQLLRPAAGCSTNCLCLHFLLVFSRRFDLINQSPACSGLVR